MSLFSTSVFADTINIKAHSKQPSSYSIDSKAISGTTSFTATTGSTTSKGTYYTKGTTKTYNGRGYKTVGAKQSPIATMKSLDIEISNEELKECQYLYETKNMISALGVGDIEGYVSLDDLYSEDSQPNTPEETVAYMNKIAKSNEKYKSIPFYDKDGKTIIGEYHIDL